MSKIKPITMQKASTPIRYTDSTSAKVGETYINNSLRITPNIHNKGKGNLKVSYADGGRTMQIIFEGVGWEIDAKNIRETLIRREYENGATQTLAQPKKIPPERVVVSIDGEYNRFYGVPVGADVTLNGDCNIIQTSDADDNITINGFSNIVGVYDGNDTVIIQKGSGNRIYLGDGDDTCIAQKDNPTNVVWSGNTGHDKVENVTYFKNKDLSKNNLNLFLSRTKQKASEAGTVIYERAKEAYGVAKDTAVLIKGGAKKASEYNPWLDKLETDRQAYRIEYGNKLRAAGYSEKQIKETLDNMELGEKKKK